MGELYLRKTILDIEGSGSTKIDGLRVSFNVEKTNEGNPNTCDLEIYNLSDNTRSALEAEGAKVRVQVGYEGLSGGGNVEQVFVGDVTKVVHDRQRADILTQVELADGDNKFRVARHDKGYPKGAKNKQIFDDVINASQLQKGKIVGIPEFTYENGFTLNGLVKDHLDDLCKKNKLEWSIQDESLQIIPEELDTGEQIILLSPDTGLVGFPAPTADGVEFESLLQPKLNVGRKVQLKSRVVSGTFKLRRVKHTGDNQRGDFRSVCEATSA